MAGAARACRASGLRLHVAGTDTGAGTTAVTVAVTNTSAAPCGLTGYPVLSLTAPDGHVLPVTVRRGTGPVFRRVKSAPVVLAPRGRASFLLLYRNFGAAGGRPCAAGRRLRAGLPGGSGQLSVAARLAPCGTVWTSPLRAGAGQSEAGVAG